MGILKDIATYKSSIILVITPILFSPLIFVNGTPAKCAFCVLVMGIYWMCEVVPLAVTAFIPVFAFPILHILPSSEVCKTYLLDTNFLFVGGLIVAVAVEKSKLHQRVALKVLTIVGSQPQWVLLGFMSVTAFLSMWISNTATTAMMVPIAQQVIVELIRYGRSEQQENEAEDVELRLISAKTEQTQDNSDAANHMSPEKSSTEAELDVSKMSDSERNLAKAMMICICFASNIGGTGTLTGTAPNIVMLGQVNDNLYKGKPTALNFATWMGFATPPMIICLIGCWVCLVVHFLGWRTFLSIRKRRKSSGLHSDGVAELLRNKYTNLPPMSFAENSVLLCFGVLLLLWICRAPGGKGSGYDPLFNYDYKDGKRIYSNYYTDATSAMFIAFLLFCLPDEKPDFLCFKERNKSQPPKQRGSLIDWPTMQAKFPWSIVLLLGGSFALAEGVKSSGLSDLVGAQLHLIHRLPLVLIQAVCILLAMCITSVSSNTVTASILIPIVNGLAMNIGVNPLALIFPTVFACSFAFTLPVSTPPNAIVFSYGMLRVSDMIKAGLFVSVVCLVVLIVCLNSYCLLIFNLHAVPEWAVQQVTGTLTNLTFTTQTVGINGTI